MKKALAAIGAGALLVTGLAAPASADGSTTYDLIASGGSVATSIDIGDVTVGAPAGGEIAIHVVVNGEIDPDNAVETRVYGVAAQAECAIEDFPLSRGNPIPGQMSYSDTFPDGTRDFSFTLPDPGCAEAPLVFVHTDAKELGGLAGVQQAYGGETWNFKITKYPGTTSYFDTTFTSGPLAGQTFPAGCLDEDNNINVNKQYTAEIYSPFNLPDDIQIAEPGNIAAVTWLLNNAPATVDINGVEQAVTKGDVQVAIWLILGESVTNPGSPYSLARAQALAALALQHTDYVPVCGDVIPLVLYVPGSQTTTVQTTYVALSVPCETLSETAVAMDTSVVVTEKGNERYGYQFPGSNWFSYVPAA